MLKKYKTDLHIHSCLSPCADLDMSPKRIVETALEKALNIIALCDHNSAENVYYILKAAEGSNLTVLPGMEITSVEEVHTVGIFPSLTMVLAMQNLVYSHLQQGVNDPSFFGEQIVANEVDEVERFNTRLLIGSTSLTVKDIVHKIHEFNGLAIAAHIDRESYGIISQLGFIPEDLGFDAAEIVNKENSKNYGKFILAEQKPPFICSSDAHDVETIGSRFTEFLLEKPSFTELKRALEEINGRMIFLDGE